MKSKVITPVLSALFALMSSAPGQTVKAIVESGGSTLAYGAEPSKFATLDHVDLYTPATKASVTRIYFGFEVTFPEDVAITLTEITAYLRKDGSPYQSAPVPKFAPVGTSFPYCVVYNAAGTQTSVDFSNTTTGTTVTGKRLVIGALRWKLGANFPVEQLPLNTSYAEGLVIKGSYQIGSGTPVPFEIQPGDPSQNTSTVKYAYAAVGVGPALSKEDWVRQLIPGPVSVSEGGLHQSFTDPSGSMDVPGGHTVTSGWQTSVDLAIWEPLTSTPPVISGNTITFSGPMLDPRRFFRLGSDGVVTNSVSWWTNDT